MLELAMPSAYRPRAAKGVTDDYRCFVLDPKLSGDVSVTSARIRPGASKVVHHVILFRISAAQVAEAARLDATSSGPGWTCFGGTGIGVGGTGGSVQAALNDSNWIAAWAPGSSGGRLPDGNGVPLPAGSRIVMQVHYNLLNGKAPDRSRAVLTVAPASAGLARVQTVLLPAPVELACAKASRGGSAIGPRRSSTSRASTDRPRRSSRRVCCSSAGEARRPCRRARSAAAIAGSRRRRGFSASQGTCTCWEPRSGSS